MDKLNPIFIFLLIILLGFACGYKFAIEMNKPMPDNSAQIINHYRQQNTKLSNELKVYVSREQLLSAQVIVLRDSLGKKHYENEKLYTRLDAIKPLPYKPSQLDSLWASRYPQ